MENRQYELTDEQFKTLILALDAARRAPVMLIGGSVPRSPQKVANDEWCRIGRECGFDGMTVLPIPGKGERFFTAVPVRQPRPGRSRLNIVFDGPPGPEAGRFVGAEDAFGDEIRGGRWIVEGDRHILAIDELPTGAQ